MPTARITRRPRRWQKGPRSLTARALLNILDGYQYLLEAYRQQFDSLSARQLHIVRDHQAILHDHQDLLDGQAELRQTLAALVTALASQEALTELLRVDVGQNQHLLANVEARVLTDARRRARVSPWRRPALTHAGGAPVLTLGERRSGRGSR